MGTPASRMATARSYVRRIISPGHFVEQKKPKSGCSRSWRLPIAHTRCAAPATAIPARKAGGHAALLTSIVVTVTAMVFSAMRNFIQNFLDIFWIKQVNSLWQYIPTPLPLPLGPQTPHIAKLFQQVVRPGLVDVQKHPAFCVCNGSR